MLRGEVSSTNMANFFTAHPEPEAIEFNTVVNVSLTTEPSAATTHGRVLKLSDSFRLRF